MGKKETEEKMNMLFIVKSHRSMGIAKTAMQPEL